jgi:hypothetical protein
MGICFAKHNLTSPLNYVQSLDPLGITKILKWETK